MVLPTVTQLLAHTRSREAEKRAHPGRCASTPPARRGSSPPFRRGACEAGGVVQSFYNHRAMPETPAAIPVTPSMRLDGLVGVVTGAGRGLGRGCALALADAGAEVVLVSRTQAELDRLAGEIRGRGGKARTLVCDVLDAGQVGERIGGLARIDVLVNNAGMNIPELFVDGTGDH